jgi:hypothetical protein
MMKSILFCLAATFAWCGCDTPVNENSSYDYSVEQQIGCFCPNAGVWVKLFVKADTIADAVTMPDNIHLSYEERRPFRTIKGLQELIPQIDTGKYDVKITMDSAYNYPSYIYFTPKAVRHGDTVQVVTDAQMVYTTKNFVKLH